MARLPHHLRFLENLASADPDRLDDHFPKTAMGKLLPRSGETTFDSDGISYIGPLDGTMVPIEAENAEPMEENIWYAGKFSALVRAIEDGDHPFVDPGYADIWVEGGKLMAQVRDGNHRAFAPIAAGSPSTWVLMSDRTRQDLDLREPGSDKTYRLIRAAQKSAGAPLFVRRRQSRVVGSKYDELLEVERKVARWSAEIGDHHRHMLETYGPAASGFSLEEQSQRPQLFWRIRMKELMDSHGSDWVYDHIVDSESGRRIAEVHQQMESDSSRLYDLRRAAGLGHGERLDPTSGRVVRNRN